MNQCFCPLHWQLNVRHWSSDGENVKSVVTISTLKSKKNLQLVANNGMTILYVSDDVSLMDCLLSFYDIPSFLAFPLSNAGNF